MRTHTHLIAVVGALTLGGSIVLSQSPAPSSPPPAPSSTPAAPAAAAQAPQGGRGAVDPPGADFLKRPPVVRQAPEAEQQTFLLPPGYKIEPVLTDPLIEDPVGVTFDGNGRMYVLEMRSYMQDADGSNVARADQPHLAPRRHRRRRHVRQAHRVRRQDGDAAHRLSAAGRRASSRSRPTTATCTSTPTPNGDGVADKKELFYAGRRPRHEHGVAARRADLGARQLALHDLQPVPAAHRAGRQAAARRDRAERRPVVVGAGQLRQDVVGRRRRRDRSGQLPGADRLRRLQRCRTTSSRTSRCRGRRRAASPTCRAA